jgi:hypothetical protein
MTGNKPMMVAAILLATVACTVAVDWEPASLITADTLPPCRVSMNNAWGVQAYDNDGNGQDVVHVAYWNETNGYNDVHYLRTTNSGTDWNELFDISDPEDEDNACQPAVAVWGSVWNNHELCVAFYDEDEISEDQRYSIMSRRNDSCGEQNDHWKSIDRRSGSSAEWDEDCSHPSAATSQGPSGKYYLHVVWDDWHDDQLGSVIWYDNVLYDPDDDLSYGSYRSQVTTWDGYEDLSPSIAAVWVEGMMSYSVYLHVVYYGRGSESGNADEVWYVRSTNNGSDWSQPVNLSNSADLASQAPSIALTGGSVIAVWQEEDPGDHRLRIAYAQSTDLGSSWGTAQALPDSVIPQQDRNTAPACFTPSVACYGDYVYIACQAGWGDTITPGYGVMFIASSDNGSTWTAEGLGGYTDDEPDLDEGEEGLFPTISVSSGSTAGNKFLSVVYSGYDANDDYRVYWLRGGDIEAIPRGGGQSRNGPLARRVRMDVQPTVVRGMARVRVTFARPGPYSVAVYDACGQRVRILSGSSSASGTGDLTWDGTDDHGRRVAAGTYLLRLQSGSSAASRCVQLLTR